MPEALTIDDATVLQKALLALLERYTDLTPAELPEMDATVPTPHWRADNREREDARRPGASATRSKTPSCRTRRRPSARRCSWDSPSCSGSGSHPTRRLRRASTRGMARRLARTIEILPLPATVH